MYRVYGGKRYASDASTYLIALWKSLQLGWEPPDEVTEAEYEDIRNNKDKYHPALVAFVGFGVSWGGKWFGGYARNQAGVTDTAMFAGRAKRSLESKMVTMRDVEFFYADFMDCQPPCENMLIYCDPPYEGTTGYGAVPDFDSTVFWNRVRYLSSCGHTVIVSEYDAPGDFKCVMTQDTKLFLNDEGKDVVDKLFALNAPVLQMALL